MRILILDSDFHRANPLAVRACASGHVAELAEPHLLADKLISFDPDLVLVNLEGGPSAGRAARAAVSAVHRRAAAVVVLGHLRDPSLVNQRCALRADVDDIVLTPLNAPALAAAIELARIRHRARRVTLA